MFKVNPKQMIQIKAVVGKSHEAQEAIFNALDFDPYEDGGGSDSVVVGGYDSVVMERERYESERKERLENPADYGICETEERSEEIKAGAALTDGEERAIDECIFDGDDTFIVISTFSDNTDEIIAVTVQQSWGQLGLNVRSFLGFFSDDVAAQKAIEQADYVTFEET